MKLVLLFCLLSIAILPVNSQFANVENHYLSASNLSFAYGKTHGLSISSQQPGSEKMMATVFRAQEFCRIELKDFEWKVDFNIVSATVYFSGANFTHVEKAFINSKSLKPLRRYMDRCIPGTIVIFDNVKIIGPDKEIRPIAGVSYMLH